MNKKIIPALVAVLAASLVVGTVAFAQDTGNGTGSTTAQSIQVPSPGYPLVGAGIGASTSDQSVFYRIGVGIFDRMNSTANTTQTSGVVSFNNERLQATSIAIGSGAVSGDLLRNSTTVGSFSLNQVSGANRWTGTLTVDGQSYNLYIFNVPGYGMGMGQRLTNIGNSMIRQGQYLKQEGRVIKWHSGRAKMNATT